MADHRQTWKRSAMAEAWKCSTCGLGIAVDEDGCCATCGRDAVAVRVDVQMREVRP